MLALRTMLIVIHRWVGLLISTFLIVAGLTGSILAFYDELDETINPSLHQYPSSISMQPLSPIELLSKIQKRFPHAHFDYINLSATPEHSVVFFSEVIINGEAADEIFVNRYNGEILGHRLWGDIRQGWKNLLPFIFILHNSLALDVVGEYLLGIIALLWTLDCFIGLWITLPTRVKRPKKNCLRRWRPAWRVRWHANSYKLNFDLHRAGGLWVWFMLLVLAWSSVSFNLRDPIYNPVMNYIFDMHDQLDNIDSLPEPLLKPPLGLAQILKLGRNYAQQQAQLQSFELGDEDAIYYEADKGVYLYDINSSASIRDNGSTRIIISAIDGRYLGVVLPNHESIGWQLDSWTRGLHQAQVGGLAMQIFISVMGLVVAVLSATGVIIWWRKRSARVKTQEKLKKRFDKATL